MSTISLFELAILVEILNHDEKLPLVYVSALVGERVGPDLLKE